MGRFRTRPPPEGWELIEPTLLELDKRLRDVENEPHEGKRVAESTWPVFRLHHQKSRYIYELYYRHQSISCDLYEYCLQEKIADAALIAKWKKPGYERLCCLRCIQTRDTNFSTTCICRVPKDKMDDARRPCSSCQSRGIAGQCRDGIRKVAKYLLPDILEPADRAKGAALPVASGQLVLDHLAAAAAAPGSDSSLPFSSSNEDELHDRGDSDSAGSETKSGESNQGIRAGARFLSAKKMPNKKSAAAPVRSASPLDLFAKILSPPHTSPPAEDACFSYAAVTQPFPYLESNHALMAHVEGRGYSESDRVQLWKSLSSFRPSILDSVRRLSAEDLLFMEQSFQRIVLESARLLGETGTPTALWRRSGELVSINEAFSYCSGWPASVLLARPYCFYELLSDASLLEYWRAFGHAALDASTHSIHTRLALVAYGGDEHHSRALSEKRPVRMVETVAWLTIKRDVFDLPLCIIGHFLPTF